MSIFNELLPKLIEISNSCNKNFNDDLKAAFDYFDKFEEDFQNERSSAREKTKKDKNALKTLKSINEDDGDTNKSDPDTVKKLSNGSETASRSSTNSSSERQSKKRSKDEVDDILSPELEKRQKRNASVKAQSYISKQVNMKLTQKMRREKSTDKLENDQYSRGHHNKVDEKENNEPKLPVAQIKLEKISLPPEPMETELLLVNIDIKQEMIKDNISMPPPAAPVPKPRKALAKEKSSEVSEDESTSMRRSTRSKKPTDAMPPPPGTSTRGARSSARGKPEPPEETRPKRTRAKKKVSNVAATNDSEKETMHSSQETLPASPPEKPRPKRTRRAQKAEEKPDSPKRDEQHKTPESTQEITTQDTSITQPQSPIIPHKEFKAKHKKDKTNDVKEVDKLNSNSKEIDVTLAENDVVDCRSAVMDETRVIAKDMDSTVVLPNGVYNHAPVTPKSVNNMNLTLVLERCDRNTLVLGKTNGPMDATVVIDKGPVNVTDDNSLMTDDSETEANTPPKKEVPQVQPTSAVKEKVQQFEELATRVTRTKTRALAKKEEEDDNHTPPDKVSKAVLSSETLKKMNSLIFNGKAPQVSSSASKLRPISGPPKSHTTSSTSKLSALNRFREVAEETLKKEDARKKKEAMLEAKRELQKRKREEKMQAAAAARSAAERERQAAAEAADRERRERQAHADHGRLQRVKEVERKKQELARKAAETEERRRAEEAARLQRLERLQLEQRRADLQRRRHLDEMEANKREEALMAKEMEQKQREYIEKQKKQRMEDKAHTPFKMPNTPGKPPPQKPVHMEDGFQYLNSDEEADSPVRKLPEWTSCKSRRARLAVQARVLPRLVDRLFSVRVHSPDLRALFPSIERARLKRTSSAVWRTPPAHPPALRPLPE